MGRRDPEGGGEPSRLHRPSNPRESGLCLVEGRDGSPNPEALIDALPLACCVIDAAGRVVWANATFGVELGPSGAGCVGQALAAWFSPSQRAVLERELRAANAGTPRHQHRRHELGTFTLADRRGELALVAVALEPSGDGPRWLVTLLPDQGASSGPRSEIRSRGRSSSTDVEADTERGLALERATLEARMSRAAHDVGNLLQGVMGCLNLALSSATTTARARDYTQQALNAVRNGTALVRELKSLGGEPRPRPGAADRVAACSTLAATTLASGGAAPRPQAAPAFSGRALLVEDDWRVRIGIRYYLQQLGFEVIEAGDVDEALSHADGSVCLLVTDVILPEITGPSIRQLLREAHPELKALYISAHPARYLIDQGLLEAGDPILQKPFDLQELAYRLTEVCSPARSAAPLPMHAAGSVG